MIDQRLKAWVESQPSCLESDDPGKKESHLQQLGQFGRCGMCGRCSEGFQITVTAGDYVRIWTREDDSLIAMQFNAVLIVFPAK